MKILIVEDEVLIREGMSDYLMECGYEVFEAGDGQEALGPLSQRDAGSGLAGYPSSLSSMAWKCSRRSGRPAQSLSSC